MCKSVGNFAENLNLGKRVLPPHVILEDTVKKSTQILTFSYYLTGIHTVSFANLEEPPEELLVRSIDNNFVMELKASIEERGHIGATVLPVLTKDSFDESNPSGSQFYTLVETTWGRHKAKLTTTNKSRYVTLQYTGKLCHSG